MTNRIRIAATATTVALTAITLAACSSSSSSPADSNPSSGPATRATAPAGGGSQATAPAGTGKSVTATETEFHIALASHTLKAGTYTFTVKNAGKITHALTVDGPGVEDKSTGDISPGSTSKVTVTLAAGSYDVYCPVGNHKMEGMDETVKVD